MSKSCNIRPALFATYKFVVNNWAVYADDVAKGTDQDVKTATKLLERLRSVGLLATEHVNGEKALTWQSFFDVENEANVPARSTRAFNKVYPKDSPVNEATTGRRGATGPRYSEDQLAEAERLRKAGHTMKDVAAALSIKSPAYLASVLKKREAAKKVRKSTKS